MPGFKNKKEIPQFSRPLTSVGSVDREWRSVYPDTLEVGDTVAGYGVVLETVGEPDCSDQVWILAGSPESKDYFLDNDVLVKAFVRKV